MKIHALLITGLALVLTACGEKEPAAPAQGDEAGMVAEPGVAEVPDSGGAIMGSEAFIRHMHQHASHLEGLNAALSAGDLEAAQTPAHWLLRHEEVTGFPADWQPHIDGMRTAARGVADATDIAAARSAAQRITESCRGCHSGAGIDIDLSALQLD